MAFADSFNLTPRAGVELSRRNTIANDDSPFNSRRPQIYRSTPLNGQKLANFPELDASQITKVSGREVFESSNNSTETRGYREHLFGNSSLGLENRQRRQLENNLFPNIGGRTSLTSTASVDKSPFDDLRESPDKILSTNRFQSSQNSGEIPPPSGRKRFFPTTATLDSSIRKNGPPLRSLHDYTPPPKRSHTMKEVTTTKPIETADEEDYWVTIFGFSPSQKTYMLEFFGRHGQIVRTEESNGSNWIHVRYSFPEHAEEATRRNGFLIDNTMIGVIRSKKPAGIASVNASSFARTADDTNVPAPTVTTYLRNGASALNSSFSFRAARDNNDILNAGPTPSRHGTASGMSPMTGIRLAAVPPENASGSQNLSSSLIQRIRERLLR